MAKSSRKPDAQCQDLTQKSDFFLLNSLTEQVTKERSQQLQQTAWEIIRRYTAHLAAIPPTHDAKPLAGPDDPLWGDAKRAEAMYGLKRGVLNSLAEHGLIKSKSLDQGRNGKRAKRLYHLGSIQEYLDADK